MFPFRPRRLSIAWLLLLSLSGVTALAQNQPAESFDSIVQSANAARDSGNADEAIRDYTRALALRPNWAEGWWDLGTMQYQANHYADAVVSLDKLTALAPDAAAGWSILGLSQFETKDYSGALTSLENAQKLGGIDDADIQRVSSYHLGLLLIRNGQFDRAMALLQSVFKQSPPAQVKTAMGMALLRIPLLPTELDPSREGLVNAAGTAAASGDPVAFVGLLREALNVPWIHYDYARVLDAEGRTEDALAQQKLETGISPQSALPWIQISGLELKLKQPQPALAAARQAVALDARSSAAHNALAKALTANGDAQQAAVEEQTAAQLPQVEERRDPRMIAIYGIHGTSAASGSGDIKQWNAAMHDYAGGNYSEAVTALKSWVERNPGDGTAWAVMGLSEYEMKDYDNARIHLQRGINLGLRVGPQEIQLATDRLALLMIRAGQFDAASALLTPLAGKPPMSAQIDLALGLALFRIPVLPEDLDTQQNGLAQAGGAIVELLLASRYADAFPAFQKLIAEHPATPWLHYAYGDALNDLSRYDDAKAQMLDEAKLSPKSALPWIRIAAIDIRQHLPADALKAAQTAVSLGPDLAEAHYQLGRAWLETGDPQNAISELEKANSLTPNNPEIHFALARAYTKAHLPEKAAAERAAFIQLKSSDRPHPPAPPQ